MKKKSARQLAKETLDKIERRLGAGHPTLIKTMREMADAYQLADRNSEAFEMLDQAITHASAPVADVLAKLYHNEPVDLTDESRERVLLVASLLSDLAEVAPDTGKEQLLEHALTIGQAVNAGAPEVGGVAYRLGQVYAEHEAHDSAAAMFREALRLPCSPNRRALTNMMLAKSLEVLGNTSEAVALAKEALFIWEKAFGYNSPGVLPAVAMLARLDGPAKYQERLDALSRK